LDQVTKDLINGDVVSIPEPQKTSSNKRFFGLVSRDKERRNKMSKTNLNRKNKTNKNNPTKRIFKFIAVLALSFILIGLVIVIKVYSDTSNSVNETYRSVQQERQKNKYTREVNLNNQEPFSVLLLGIDTGDLGRVEQ